MSNNNNNNNNSASNRINLVVLGNNTGYRQLCQDLRSNRRTDLKDASIWLKPCSQRYLTEFAECMQQNKTVQRLVIAAMTTSATPISDDGDDDDRRVVGPDMEREMRSLGNIVADNCNITKVTAVVRSCRGLHAFWEGVSRSHALRVLTISRLHSKGSLAPLVESLSALQTFRYLFLKDCSLNTVDAQAISEMLEKQNSFASAFSMTNCSIQEDNKVRLANAIAKSTSLRFLRVDDDLRGPVGAAFGKALAQNKRLIEVQFLKCCVTGLEYLADAIKDNVTLIKARVSALNECRQSVAFAQQVRHIAKLNRRGRRFLRDNAQRPQLASLEKTWLCMLLRDRSNHQIVYSLVHDYPSVFVRAMNLDVLERLDKEKSAESSDNEMKEPPRKRIRLLSEEGGANAQV